MKLLLVPHAAEHVFQELQQQMAGAADGCYAPELQWMQLVDHHHDEPAAEEAPLVGFVPAAALGYVVLLHVGAADVEQARVQEHQGWCWSSWSRTTVENFTFLLAAPTVIII